MPSSRRAIASPSTSATSGPEGDASTIRLPGVVGVRLGAELPDPPGLLTDVQVSQLVVRDAPLQLGSQPERPDLFTDHPPRTVVPELPLLDRAVLAVHEHVELAGAGAAVEARAVDLHGGLDRVARDVAQLASAWIQLEHIDAVRLAVARDHQDDGTAPPA